MRTRVKCINCSMIWDKVENTNTSMEFTEDVQTTCPGCNSNAYEILLQTEKENPFINPDCPIKKETSQ